MMGRQTKTPLVLLLVLSVLGVGHSTELVEQKSISSVRSLAGHVQVLGSNEPAKGVTVQLCGVNWKTVLETATTDNDGYFSLRTKPNGKLFYLRLSADGMDTYLLRVRIKKDSVQELAIHLSVAT